MFKFNGNISASKSQIGDPYAEIYVFMFVYNFARVMIYI